MSYTYPASSPRPRGQNNRRFFLCGGSLVPCMKLISGIILSFSIRMLTFHSCSWFELVPTRQIWYLSLNGIFEVPNIYLDLYRPELQNARRIYPHRARRGWWPGQPPAVRLIKNPLKVPVVLVLVLVSSPATVEKSSTTEVDASHITHNENNVTVKWISLKHLGFYPYIEPGLIIRTIGPALAD